MSEQKSKKEMALEHLGEVRNLISGIPEMDVLKISFNTKPESVDLSPTRRLKINKVRMVLEYEYKIEVDVLEELSKDFKNRTNQE